MKRHYDNCADETDRQYCDNKKLDNNNNNKSLM